MKNTKKGREAYGNGEYATSGDFYTQAAYSALSHDAITDAIDGQIAAGLYSLLMAAYGYRRAQQTEQAKNRCQQGILVATDIRDTTVEDPIREGILTEYIGAFETVGAVSVRTDAYEAAMRLYSTAGIESSFSWPSNPLIDKNISFLTWVHRESGTPLPTNVDVESDFTGRLSYKRSRINSILENHHGE